MSASTNKINSQSLEDTQVGYTSQKYSLEIQKYHQRTRIPIYGPTYRRTDIDWYLIGTPACLKMCSQQWAPDELHLKAPTGILLGATSHESAASSLRFTWDDKRMAMMTRVMRNMMTRMMRNLIARVMRNNIMMMADMKPTSSKNWPWLASTSRPANLNCIYIWSSPWLSCWYLSIRILIFIFR